MLYQVEKAGNLVYYISIMEELDFSDQIRGLTYPIEEDNNSLLCAAERFDGKKRSELKDSAFLDPERRSFPVVDCKNVKAAVSTWGMYKGPMSFETFKSKLKARAKQIGCEDSLPDSWAKASEEEAQAKSKKDWEKTDKKELKRDDKKEKGEHEKDAVKDDQSKINKLKKGKPSEKKSVEIHDLKKDQEFDDADKVKYTKAEKKNLPPWLKDKKELDKDSDKEKEEHEKDAVKDDKKQIKDLKKDEKEDKKSEKKDKSK
jgi:hypothetical protein